MISPAVSGRTPYGFNRHYRRAAAGIGAGIAGAPGAWNIALRLNEISSPGGVASVSTRLLTISTERRK